MTVRVSIRSEMLAWARDRSRVSPDDLGVKFPALSAWEAGTKQPTLKQLEKFAEATHTPIGYLFLPEPPEEELPVPDFRTIGDVAIGRASPDLLDTIYQCQQRQDWYRDFARIHREDRVAFVGTLTVDVDIVDAARQIRSLLNFGPTERGSSWSEAFSRLSESAELRGVLVMVNGVVGSNTHRKLDSEEFRGFALSDDLAPLVFVNGTDTKAAQIFTLAHELAHIWLGESGVDDADMANAPSSNAIERWCNAVAAEFLVPAAELQGVEIDRGDLTDDLQRLARIFKVSTLVVLRRLFDVGYLTLAQLRVAYSKERERVLALIEERPSGGGNFYNTQPVRVSKRFARALIESTLEGQTLHRDAYQMLGFKKHSTFDELARHLGVL
jgi:Zn-dependent peptidase ImmA (M78 family)